MSWKHFSSASHATVLDRSTSTTPPESASGPWSGQPVVGCVAWIGDKASKPALEVGIALESRIRVNCAELQAVTFDLDVATALMVEKRPSVSHVWLLSDSEPAVNAMNKRHVLALIPYRADARPGHQATATSTHLPAHTPATSSQTTATSGQHPATSCQTEAASSAHPATEPPARPARPAARHPPPAARTQPPGRGPLPATR